MDYNKLKKYIISIVNNSNIEITNPRIIDIRDNRTNDLLLFYIGGRFTVTVSGIRLLYNKNNSFLDKGYSSLVDKILKEHFNII